MLFHPRGFVWKSIGLKPHFPDIQWLSHWRTSPSQAHVRLTLSQVQAQFCRQGVPLRLAWPLGSSENTLIQWFIIPFPIQWPFGVISPIVIIISLLVSKSYLYLIISISYNITNSYLFIYLWIPHHCITIPDTEPAKRHSCWATSLRP
jgi:hypothetical protein